MISVISAVLLFGYKNIAVDLLAAAKNKKLAFAVFVADVFAESCVNIRVVVLACKYCYGRVGTT